MVYIRVFLMIMTVNCFSIDVHDMFANIILDMKKSCYYDCVQPINKGITDAQTMLRIVKNLSMNYTSILFDCDTSLDFQGCKRPLFIMVLEFSNFRTINSELFMKRCSSGSTWLVFLDNDVILEDVFTHINISFNCEFLVAQLENDHIVLTEVHRVSSTFPLQTYSFINWTSDKSFTCPAGRFYVRKGNLQGLVLKTVIKEEFFNEQFYSSGLGRNYFFSQVWFMLMKYLNFTLGEVAALPLLPHWSFTCIVCTALIIRHIVGWLGGEGPSCFILERAAQVKNIIYVSEYIYSYDFGNGIVDEDDSWTGIVGMLQNSEVDVTAEGISMTDSRLSVVDYIAPIWSERKYPFMRATKIFKTSWKNFLNPFDRELWFAVIIIILIISSGLFVINMLLLFSENREQNTSFLCLFGQSLFHIFGSFINQVQMYKKQSSSTRILKLISYWTSIIILASYSASFYSFLTLRSPVIPFSDFEELLEDGTYKLGVLRYSSLLTFFQNANDPVLKELYTKIIAPYNHSLPASSLEGLQRACSDPKYAHMHSLEGVAKYTEPLKCQIMLAPRAKIETLKSMATVKRSPYLGLFKHMLYKMQECGIIQKLHLKTVIELPEIETPKGIMDVKSVMPIIYILLLGMSLSLFLFALELIIQRIKYCNKRRYNIAV